MASQIVTPEVDDGTKHRELLERTRRELQRSTKLVETLKLIDNLQRLGIAYYFEDDINAILDQFSDGLPDEDLFTTALCFRLLRDNGYKTGSGINSRHLQFVLYELKDVVKRILCFNYYLEMRICERKDYSNVTCL